MNGTILGIGPLELIIIVVLVLLIFGPERLPTLMRQAGQGVRKMREFYVRFASDLRTELSPFEEEIKVLRDVTDELRRDLAEIRDAADLRTAVQPITIDTSVPTKPAQIAAPNGAAATTTPATTPATSGASTTTTTTATTTAPSPTTNGVAATGTTQPAATQPAPSTVSTALRNGTPAALPAAPPLAEGNPWAQLGEAIRADALDDDNPWAVA